MGEEITIQLIHPVYLDVPMLMSFAAALEGGVSLASEVLSEHGTAEKSAKATSGKIGLSGLVSSLLRERQGLFERTSDGMSRCAIGV